MGKTIGTHNYIRDLKNRMRKFDEEKKYALIHENKNKIENENKYGKQKDAELINIGKKDRQDRLSPKVFEDESKKKAYNYGYFERGSVLLEGEFYKNNYSIEEQMMFGISDQINKVPEKHLKGLTKYPAYEYGVNYQKGREAYDYVIEKGMTLEEYIFTMHVFFPEVKSEAFKEGYLQREKELAENKPKHR